jgi:biopolymer transport protein ExbB/TolQ
LVHAANIHIVRSESGARSHFILRLHSKATTNKRQKTIRNHFFIGSLALLIGIFGQVLGIMQALDAFEAYDNVSLSVLAGGFRVTMIAPAYGLVLFVFLLSFGLFVVTYASNSKPTTEHAVALNFMRWCVQLLTSQTCNP